MKHIKLFEAFQDENPTDIQGLSGMTAKMVIYDSSYDWQYIIEGPIEHEDRAKEIGMEMHDHLVEEADYYFRAIRKEDDDEAENTITFEEYMKDVIDYMDNEKEELAKIGWTIKLEEGHHFRFPELT
jgi:hypothetical protein